MLYRRCIRYSLHAKIADDINDVDTPSRSLQIMAMVELCRVRQAPREKRSMASGDWGRKAKPGLAGRPGWPVSRTP